MNGRSDLPVGQDARESVATGWDDKRSGGESFEEIRIDARSKCDFRFAGFRQYLQFVKAPAFGIPFQNESEGFDDLVLQGAFICLAGFDRHHVAARLSFFVEQKALQWHLLSDLAQFAAGLDPSDADDAAIPFSEPLTKGIPVSLRNFRSHSHRVRPRAGALRLTLLRFNGKVLGERRASLPPPGPGRGIRGFQRFLTFRESVIATGTNFFCV